LEEAAPQFRRRFPNAIDATDEILPECLAIMGTAVSQIALDQSPSPFVGIEFRRRRRDAFDAQTRVLVQRFPAAAGSRIALEHRDKIARDTRESHVVTPLHPGDRYSAALLDAIGDLGGAGGHIGLATFGTFLG